MATKYWLGGAAGEPTIYEIIPTARTAGDEVYISVNSKKAKFRVVTGTTVAAVCKAIKAIINGDGPSGDEIQITLGTTMGEFRMLTASLDNDTTPTKVYLKGPADGRDFTPTPGIEGGPSTWTTTATDNGTGPYHFSDVNNWSGGSVPVAADDLVFDHRAANGLKYGLNKSTVTYASVTITKGYRHQIGLPQVNTEYGVPFNESLDTYLRIDGCTNNCNIGEGDGQGSGLIRLECTSAWTCNVYGTATRTESEMASVVLKGGTSGTLTIYDGDVSIAPISGETNTFTTINVGAKGTNPTLWAGSGSTQTTVKTLSGKSTFNSAITTLTVSGGEVVARSGNITTVTINNGATLTYMGAGTLSTVTILSGGFLDFGKLIASRTVTNMTVHGGGSWSDPANTVTYTNAVALTNCAKVMGLSA